MTFEEIAAIEPRLLDLEKDIEKRITELPNRWAVRDRAWYGEFKPRFIHLVGFMADKPELRNCDVYDTVYRKFVKILEA